MAGWFNCFILYDAAQTYAKKLFWEELHKEVAQSREVTFQVKYMNAIVFANIVGGAIARFARSWLWPCPWVYQNYPGVY